MHPAADEERAGKEFAVLAEKMGVSPSNISFHLKELERSGLIAQRRESRSIVYSADYDALSGLVQFLMLDCCAGHPRVTGVQENTDACCASGPEKDVANV